MDQFKTAVRPVVTLMFSAAFIYMAVMQTVSTDAFIGIATLVIKYWFDSREEKK